MMGAPTPGSYTKTTSKSNSSSASVPDRLDAAFDGASVLHPRTGEVLALAQSPTDVLAEWLHAVRELEADLRSAKSMVAFELHQRMDAEAQWTVTAGPWKVVGESPNRVEYDPQT